MLDDERKWRQWFEYLHGLNIEQFHIDIARAAVKSNKARPEAKPEDLQQLLTRDFYYQGMKRMFTVEGRQCAPHAIIGNKTHITRGSELIRFLWG